MARTPLAGQLEQLAAEVGAGYTRRDALKRAGAGGELIDQGHIDIRQLSQELGLDLVNLLASETNGTETFHLFDGQFYSFEEATDDLKTIWQQIHSDVSAASYPTLWDNSTARGRELDAMSITDWINAYVPGGMGSKLGQLLDVAYNIEYGAECTVQSSLNMLYLLGYAGPGQMRIFGKSNEKYHVVGGNDQIPERLAANLTGQIKMGYELTAVARNSDATWTLSFANGKTTKVDRVIIAIPFTILRGVNLKKAQFEPRKLQAINELGMGTNSKLHVGFNSRFWRDLGCNGETYADTGYQNTWEVSRGQSGQTGLLVDYTGATSARHSPRRRPTMPRCSSTRSSCCCPARTLRGTIKPRSTTGRDTSGRRARTRTGRLGSTRRSPAWSGRSRTAATSPASTRRSTSRATCRAVWRPASGRPARSSRRTRGSKGYFWTSRAAPIAPPRSPSVATLMSGGWSSTKRWGIIAFVIRLA
jgi:hypothetical protein